MKDEDKTKEQLINELVELRQRLAKSESAETKHKQAEKALRESEKRYRHLFNQSPIGIGLATPDGKVLSGNKAMEVITGYSIQELKKISLADTYVNPGDRKALIEAINRYGGVVNFPALLKRKNGASYEALLTISRFYSHKGEYLFQTICIDITEQKRVEEELRRKNEELENFVYTVSHELKSPIITLEGFVSALKEDYGSKLDEEAKGYLGFIRDASAKMGTLIKDLLELSRVGRTAHQNEEVDFSAVVEESMKVLGSNIEERGIELVVADEFPRVRCDRKRMVQVMENLLSNAIKFIGKNLSPRFEIGYKEEDEVHRFWVRDNGIGIDPRYHGKIFQLFQSLKEVTDEQGSGVGLTIVRKIIEQHGGRIWVESAKGKGSTFYFTLPK